jgi:ubiquitin C-terminal hydrolase
MEEGLNLEGLLKKMNKSETIDISDGWRCDKCNNVSEAQKKDGIYSVGRCLIIFLKRFTGRGKITIKI